MQSPISSIASKLRQHPRVRSELLAGLCITGLLMVAYAFWPLPVPAPDTAAAPAAVSGLSDAEKHQADMKRLYDLNEMYYPSDAAVQQTDQQIERQERLKDQWLQSRTVSTDASVSAGQRQEELKDQWLDRRNGAAIVTQPARAGPIPECDEVCLNAYSQQFRESQQKLNVSPACDEVCLNLYRLQLQDLNYGR